mmetsp:Transcript_26425/g.60386  ORF Transcript_26425/g.60386 Transcript_26425/m.60386 type:complete len:282 (+) Transcript_26425:1219-2064(+)
MAIMSSRISNSRCCGRRSPTPRCLRLWRSLRRSPNLPLRLLRLWWIRCRSPNRPLRRLRLWRSLRLHIQSRSSGLKMWRLRLWRAQLVSWRGVIFDLLLRKRTWVQAIATAPSPDHRQVRRRGTVSYQYVCPLALPPYRQRGTRQTLWALAIQLPWCLRLRQSQCWALPYHLQRRRHGRVSSHRGRESFYRQATRWASRVQWRRRQTMMIGFSSSQTGTSRPSLLLLAEGLTLLVSTWTMPSSFRSRNGLGVYGLANKPMRTPAVLSSQNIWTVSFRPTAS